MAKKVLTYNLSEPLNGATAATIDISAGSGNLAIDQLSGGENMLASGTLEYLENKGLPTRSVNTSNGRTTLALKAGNGMKSCFHLPWETCNGATEWQIHLNPTIPADVTAHSGGGNIRLDLSGTTLTQLTADTGGGNMDVVLPDEAINLNVNAKSGAGNVSVELGQGSTGRNSVNAKSGAGNVTVKLPGELAARIYATTGMGKTFIDPCFSKIDKNTYQSPDYDNAADKAEITIHSGAGNVSVITK